MHTLGKYSILEPRLKFAINYFKHSYNYVIKYVICNL